MCNRITFPLIVFCCLCWLIYTDLFVFCSKHSECTIKSKTVVQRGEILEETAVSNQLRKDDELYDGPIFMYIERRKKVMKVVGVDDGLWIENGCRGRMERES